MSPRPRKASDADVFATAARVMSRRGPAQLTLVEIAAEAGLTAGALVQRVGAKRGLCLALAGQVTVSGSLMTWAFYRDGPAADWMREDLGAVLRPFLAASGPARHRQSATGTGPGGDRPPAPRGRRQRQHRRGTGPK